LELERRHPKRIEVPGFEFAEESSGPGANVRCGRDIDAVRFRGLAQFRSDSEWLTGR
jgi:hypothetical protein